MLVAQVIFLEANGLWAVDLSEPADRCLVHVIVIHLLINATPNIETKSTDKWQYNY